MFTMLKPSITAERSYRSVKWPMLIGALLTLLVLFAFDAPPLQAAVPADNASDEPAFLPLITSTCTTTKRAQKEPTIFGVQMYGSTSSDSKYFEDMVASDASWVRVEVYWRLAVQGADSPTDFRWKGIDELLAGSAHGGVNVIGTILGVPSWANDDVKEVIHPDYLDEYAAFVRALVERYDGDGIDDAPCGQEVHHWEIFNEPDHVNLYGTIGGRYADVLAAAYTAAKAADPNAQILFGGVAHEWFVEDDGPFVESFPEDVLKAGGGDSIDVMAIHVYPAFAPAWTQKGSGITQKVAAFRSLLAQYGLSKPIMITEAGEKSKATATGATPATRETQASFVVALYTEALAAHVDVLIWFMLYDPNPANFSHEYGLVTQTEPQVRKVSHSTYRMMVDKMADVTFDRLLTDAETGSADMLAYKFIKPDGKIIYSAWMHPIYSDKTAPLVLEGDRAIAHDIYGDSHTILDGDDGRHDGKVSVTVSSKALLIEMEP